MQKYVGRRHQPEFALWNVADLGYLAYAAVNYASKHDHRRSRAVVHRWQAQGQLHHRPGQSVVLGPPFVFTKSNIDQFNF